VLEMYSMNCGLELSSLHCCYHGVEVTFSTRNCGALRLDTHRRFTTIKHGEQLEGTKYGPRAASRPRTIRPWSFG
jgi:hypothetical protein